MRKSAAKYLLLVLTLILTGLPGVSQDPSAVIREAGTKLACLCGSCHNTVLNCPMLHCHYSEPAKAEIEKMALEGKSSQQIIDAFVAKEGKRALSEPPAEGFNRMALIMPAIAVLIGLGLVALAIRRLRHAPVAPPVASPKKLDPQALARYKEQIDRDLAQMD